MAELFNGNCYCLSNNTIPLPSIGTVSTPTPGTQGVKGIPLGTLVFDCISLQYTCVSFNVIQEDRCSTENKSYINKSLYSYIIIGVSAAVGVLALAVLGAIIIRHIHGDKVREMLNNQNGSSLEFVQVAIETAGLK
jgi:hypothetical protein